MVKESELEAMINRIVKTILARDAALNSDETKREPERKAEVEKLEVEEPKEDVKKIVREAVAETLKAKGETYDCPCGYKDAVPFKKCPQCGKELEWQ